MDLGIKYASLTILSLNIYDIIIKSEMAALNLHIEWNKL